MKITNVKYSASYEMVLPTGQSKWEKIGLEGELEETDTPEEGLLKLKTIVEKFHEEHNENVQPEVYKTVVPTGKTPIKLRPDINIRKKYAVAVSASDMAEVSKLELLYDFTLA